MSREPTQPAVPAERARTRRRRPWLRRAVTVAGLVVAGWLLGTAAQAFAAEQAPATPTGTTPAATRDTAPAVTPETTPSRPRPTTTPAAAAGTTAAAPQPPAPSSASQDDTPDPGTATGAATSPATTSPSGTTPTDPRPHAEATAPGPRLDRGALAPARPDGQQRAAHQAPVRPEIAAVPHRAPVDGAARRARPSKVDDGFTVTRLLRHLAFPQLPSTPGMDPAHTAPIKSSPPPPTSPDAGHSHPGDVTGAWRPDHLPGARVRAAHLLPPAVRTAVDEPSFSPD